MHKPNQASVSSEVSRCVIKISALQTQVVFVIFRTSSFSRSESAFSTDIERSSARARQKEEGGAIERGHLLLDYILSDEPE